MIGFMRKKVFNDERLVQLLLLLSMLRGSPEDLCPSSEDSLLETINHELSLGTSMGNLRSQLLSSFEPNQKSIDVVLGNYQRTVLENLHSLGRYSDHHTRGDIQAYLLNAESSLTERHTPDEPESTTDNFQDTHHDEVLPEVEPNNSFDFGYDFQRSDVMFEEVQLLDALWKQDIDVGVPREAFDDDTVSDETEVETVYSKLDSMLAFASTMDKDPSKEPDAGFCLDELEADKAWSSLNFTVDSETGELLAADDTVQPLEGALNFDSAPSLSLGANDNNFDIDFNLDEALRLVDLPAEIESDLDSAATAKDFEADSGCGDSAFGDGSISPASDTSNLTDMLQTSHYHPRGAQGRLGGLVRGGSMDQRWQDLASLLSLPSSEPHHAQSPPTSSMAAHGSSPIHAHAPPVHHPHPLYPTHDTPASRGVLLHNSTLPPTMPDHTGHNITYSNSMGASSHLVASSMNLTNNTDLTVPGNDHSYKMENSSINSDMIYYQQQQHQQQQQQPQQQNSNPEMSQPNDGIWSSILNDDDLQLMDITMNEYNGRTNGEYSGGNYRYTNQEDPHRHPQKKHHLFGKRYFQENPNNGTSPYLVQNNTNIGGAGAGLPVVGSYPTHYPNTTGVAPMEGATALDPSELKYSCSMDFRTPPDVGGSNLDHVQHNHTYHMSPEGPSGLNRPLVKDKKGRKTEAEKNLSRDEKKARGLSLPITCEDIINLPMDEFNERISKFDLTEAQLSLIRDIRRRGKNKVAAQNCRKRKLDQIVHLAEEVKVFQYRKTELRNELDHYTTELSRVNHKFSRLYRHVFNSLRDDEGNPYCPQIYSLHQTEEGEIILVRRGGPQTSMDHLSKSRNSKEEPSP